MPQEVFALPLSFAQERLWVVDQLHPASSVYNIPVALHLTGSLDRIALERALTEIIRRHETLRTTFVTVDGEPRQVVTANASTPLLTTNLEHLTAAEREQAVQRLVEGEARQLFDLTRGPLLRAQLVCLGKTDHVLLLTAHHLIADGWSFDVLFAELAQLYGAYSENQASPLPELPIQYADYAIWQRQWLQGEILERQLTYWRQKLAGAPPLLQLPAVRSRPTQRSFRGATFWFRLRPELSQALKSLGQQQSTTLFMTLLAAFLALLHRYTRQDDLVVGSFVAGRTRAEVENLVGCFINTLSLRTDLSGDPSFRELLGRVRETALEAYDHQDVPFERIVAELRPERSLSYNPLVQVVFAIHNTRATSLSLPSLTAQPLQVERGAAEFDLTLQMWEDPEGLAGSVEYATDLFEEARIERMVGHYRTLLEGVVSNPDQRLSALPLLTESEYRQLIVEWNETRADYPLDQCLHELFEAQVERTPGAVAVVCGDQHLTYRELNTRANQLAHYLRGRGVGTETLVGLCVERSVEMVVGVLGILKAGGAYVPLDPAYPPERLALMLADSQADLVLTRTDMLSRLEEISSCTIVCLDRDRALWRTHSAENLESLSIPETPAYLLYTSGSTGVPKSVLGLHRGMVNYLVWLRQAYPYAAGDVACQKAPLIFVDSIWELFGPLLQGIPTVLIPETVLKDPERLVEFLAAHQITRIVLVPSFLSAILEYSADLHHQVPKLRFWITSGEAVDVELVSRFRQRLPQCTLINLYGQSEVSAVATEYDTKLLSADSETVPIGRTISNTQVYVLDHHMQPVPVGVAGELYIGGDGLARGYLNRPELTAERFVAHPFSDEPGARLYRTGDLVRYRADGNIEFLGRLDHQVKIRGFRIELGEIETALGQHPQIRAVVVVAREENPGDKRLVAYVVPRQGQVVSTGELRRFLQTTLPDYMVPAAFVELEELPLTPNGKVDRKALPLPDTARPELEATYASPRTAAEEVLAQIWAEVLGLEQVGVHDDFFELGGHSLLSIQVVARAAQAGLRLAIEDIYRNPTIAELAAHIDANEALLDAASNQAVDDTFAAIVPLTPSQRLLLSKGNGSSKIVTVLADTHYPLDLDILEKSLQDLISRHDALRTSFVKLDGNWTQIGVDQVSADLHYVDLSGAAETDIWQAIRSTWNKLQKEMALLRGPLISLAYFRLSKPMEDRVLMVVHHLVCDGISSRILLSDLQSLYIDKSAKRRTRLPATSTPFKLYAERLVEYSKSAQLAEERDYWLALPEVRSRCWPADFPEGRGVHHMEAVSASLDAATTHLLRHSVPSFYRAAIPEVLLAALVHVFGEWKGEPFLNVEVTTHGRRVPMQGLDLARTVGWLSTNFPILFDISDAECFADAVRLVSEQLLRVPHGGIGHELLIAADPEGDVGTRLEAHYDATEVSFNLLDDMRSNIDNDIFLNSTDPSFGERWPASNSWKMDFFVSLNENVSIDIMYSCNYYLDSTVRLLADRYVNTLKDAVERILEQDLVSE